MLKPSFIIAAALCGALTAETALAVWDFTDKNFSGDYIVYGGYPAQVEAHAPTPGDTKVAFSIRGTAAKEIYDAIGAGSARQSPPERECTSYPEIRVRERDALICRHSPRDGYWCTFGFDLSTGLSTWGITGGRICEG